MTSPPDFIDIFDRLERDHGVTEWRCGQIYIWPLVKFIVARDIDRYVKKKGRFNLHHGFNLQQKVAFTVNSIRGEIDNLRNPLGQADICLFTYETFRHYQIGEHWFNIFQDPLEHVCEELGLRLTTLELSNIYPPRRPHLNATHSTSLALTLIKGLPGLQHYQAYLRDDIELLNNRLDACSDVLRVEEINALKHELNMNIPFLFAAADVFERRLKIIQPSLGLLANYYSMTGLAFCLACYRSKIRCADISHGVSGQYHYAYGGWQNTPEEGYELLPNDFLSRTEEDAQALDSLIEGSPAYRPPIVVGDLAAHAWRQNLYHIADAPRAILKDIHSGKGEKLQILIAAQHIYNLPPDYLEVMKQTQDWCFYWVRFPPNYMNDVSDLSLPLPDGTYNLSEANSLPLFALFECADTIMTETSSVAEDARSWGIPSIITHEIGQLMFQERIEEGGMIGAMSVDETIEALKKIHDKKCRLEQSYSVQDINNQRQNLVSYLLESCQNKPELVSGSQVPINDMPT